MSDATSTTITLRAIAGTPLADERIRDLVVATAHSIAERNDVRVLALATTDDRLTATLNVNRLAAIGFAAELRRLTNRWYAQKFGMANLWGDVDSPDGDAE